MPTETTLHYEGPLTSAYDLVDELREAGVEVDWVPPPEERTCGAEAIAIAIIARGTYDVIVAIVGRIRQRLGSRVTVETGPPPADAPTGGDPPAGA